MIGETCTRCRVMSLVVAVAAGTLFGIGLLVSGMTQPGKVIGFLDPLSGWDATLAFVLGGAILVYAPLHLWIRARRSEPWFDIKFHLPTRRDIDLQLVLGAAIFGVGWGLGGVCPGPGIVSAMSFTTSTLLFVGAMLVGFMLRSRRQ